MTDRHSPILKCDWDHVTRANPFAKKCGLPAKVEVNGPNGYFVCGIHALSAWRIGDVDQETLTARDIKWALRDAQIARINAIMQASADRERLRLESVVETALWNWGDPVGIMSWDDVAAVAIAALQDDGMVFARLGDWKDSDDD